MFQFVTDNRSMISKAENARSPIHFFLQWRQMPFHQGDRGWRDKDMPSNITLARENNFSSRCKKSSVPKSKRSTLTYNGPSENLTSSKFALSPLCFLLGGILDPWLPSSTYEQSALELFITNVAVKYIVEMICIRHLLTEPIRPTRPSKRPSGQTHDN